MNTVTIKREYSPFQTKGTLTATRGGAHFLCHTLELPWKNNLSIVSCIPEGAYTCKWTFSPKFRKYTYQVMDVPKRTGIRFHRGNYAAGKKVDIEGCILLGEKFQDINQDKIDDIILSTATTEAFNGFMGKEDFKLVIS